MKLPQGFKAAGIKAGLKPSGKIDLGIIYSDLPLVWAFMGTTNQLKAACVSRNRSRFSSGDPVHGVIVNAGNANCANGDQGIWDNEDFASLAVNALSLPRVQSMLTASTGVVGRKLDMDKLRKAVPQLTKELELDSDHFAQAIVTTDTCTKQVSRSLRGGARIVGVCKGSGMIHPNMATMLAFVMTDAIVSQEKLREVWPDIVNHSFNQVTVDGDTSPNDMAFVFSSRQARVLEDEFFEALRDVAQELAQKIARDGEGASKLLTVNVSGARSDEEARKAAREVVRSPLVKAAMHGNDPNWGRILVAVGYSGAVSDMANLRIDLQTRTVYHGKPQAFDASEISQSLKVNDAVIDIDLAAGSASATAWGCDLSKEYVSINADYTT